MERLDQYPFEEDEYERRHRIATENKRKKALAKKRRRRLILFLLFVVIVGYFVSDYSNIRVIDISGNSFYTKEEIMDLADVHYGDKSIMNPSLLIKTGLQAESIIKKAKVKKTWDGVLTISIEEEKLIGYHKVDGKCYLVFVDKEDAYVDDETMLATVPYLTNFDEKYLNKYKNAVKNLSSYSLRLISEVSKHESSYDKNMLRLDMQDGHIVYTSLNGLKNIEYYNEILKGLKTTHRCIVFAEESNAAYSQKCE